MAEKREIISCAVYGVRLAYIHRLWEPETTEVGTGKPLDKPRYSVTGIIQKTRATWMEEPAFASIRDASGRIYAQHYNGWDVNQLIWPVKDGDRPNRQGKVSEWMKGHWFIRADTTSPNYLTIEAVQNGQAIALPAAKLGGRVIVKDGDVGIMAIGLAKSDGPNPGVKTYLNGVVFTGPGEEIKLGSRVDSAELLRQAAAQGMNVQGVGAPPAGGFGAPAGFGAPPQQSGFGAPAPQPGFGAPPTQPPAAGFGAPPQQNGFGPQGLTPMGAAPTEVHNPFSQPR
jgi:hypothetical protein